MELLRTAIEELVSAGIRSYIDLLGHGERTRSRRLFSDSLQLSALISGGPSARISPMLVVGPELSPPNDHPMRSCLILLSLRSILATLLVLKATAYWRRIPALEELQASCVRVADCVGRRSGADLRHDSDKLTCETSHETDTACGCRRNNALPTLPELAERPVSVL